MSPDQVIPLAPNEPTSDDFRRMVDSIPQLAWMARPDGHIFWYNQRWFDYTGASPDEMFGWGWRKVHHTDHVERVVSRISHSFETGEPWEDTFPLRRHDGSFRWFLSRALPIRDDRGNILRWFGTNTDVTEQRQAEERLGLLMDEVDHRAKNALAVAQAVVNLTTADDVKEYKERVSARVASLARSHSLLAEAHWGPLDLRTLLEQKFAPYRSEGAERVQIEGADVALPPSHVQTVALLLHEFITNATKYGSLSMGSGRIKLSWTVSFQALSIRWEEMNGPVVDAPTHSGFGSRLLDQLIRRTPGLDVRRDFRPTGMIAHIDIDMASETNTTLAWSDMMAAGAAEGESRAPAVLIIEDEALLAIELEGLLEDEGYAILGSAGSVKSGRALLERAKPDLAIVDCNLGKETSEPLVRELIAAGIPVILCTGYAVPPINTDGKKLPVLHKPFERDILLSTVDAVVSGQQPA